MLFLKNQRQNMMEKLVPNPFIKNQNEAYLSISLDQQSKML